MNVKDPKEEISRTKNFQVSNWNPKFKKRTDRVKNESAE